MGKAGEGGWGGAGGDLATPGESSLFPQCVLRILSLGTYGERPGNRLVFLKMASFGGEQQLSFRAPGWQCVLLHLDPLEQ